MSALHALLKRLSLADLGSIELTVTTFYGFLFAAFLAGAAAALVFWKVL